ncbi:MAG: amino acid decarboxylase [Ruminococcaceae bacterium]|nr:amino acid decarboxylase [Oscillospiraceae bacterium]
MKTPIYDFVKDYAASGTVRLHMPGHKGNGPLGCEAFDITEIVGADVLYSADGIIAESENNASELFGSAHTFFSTEGSSLCIKAMLALVTANTPSGQRRVIAARNVHKAFVYAAALLDLDVDWLYPDSSEHLCVCKIGADEVKKALDSADSLPCAVYITSPDYLGNLADIREISEVCDKYGVPLIVDNAHGAYLGFLDTSLHPLDLGASMCCDSAHKTLPVLTGGAYLHIAKKAERFVENARNTLAVFASTSPSYLTLSSLDLCNAYIADEYSQKLATLVNKLEKIKLELVNMGMTVYGDEPLKLTLNACDIGYSGVQLAQHLREQGIECEFADDEFVVLMASVQNTDAELDSVVLSLKKLEKRTPIKTKRAPICKCERAMSIRKATFCTAEAVNIANAVGRVCATPTVSCPPAVPIIVSGEIITDAAARLLGTYGVLAVDVVK